MYNEKEDKGFIIFCAVITVVVIIFAIWVNAKAPCWMWGYTDRVPARCLSYFINR